MAANMEPSENQQHPDSLNGEHRFDYISNLSQNDPQKTAIDLPSIDIINTIITIENDLHPSFVTHSIDHDPQIDDLIRFDKNQMINIQLPTTSTINDHLRSSSSKSTGNSPLNDDFAVQSVVENVMQGIISGQELDHKPAVEVSNLGSIKTNQSGVRKSNRLRTKITQISNSGSSEEAIQIQVDPLSIHSESVDDLLDDDEIFDDGDEEDDDDDDDEYIGNGQIFSNQKSSLKNGPMNAPVQNHHDEVDDVDDYYNDENEEDEDEEEFNDDDDDDEFELDDNIPLKKRKMARPKSVRKPPTNQKPKPSNNETLQLKTLLYKCWSYQMMMKRLNRILVDMNDCLMEKVLNLINIDVNKSDISLQSFIDWIQSYHLQKNLPDPVNFATRYREIVRQYELIVNEKNDLETNFEEDVDPKLIDLTIGKLIKSMPKMCTLDFLGDTFIKIVGQHKKSKKRGKSKKNTKSKSKSKSSSKSTNKTKGKHKSKSSSSRNVIADTEDEEDEEEEIEEIDNAHENRKKCLLHCSWPGCSYESKREWSLKEHINLTHTGFKHFGCKVDGCPATFFGSTELDNHMKKYHADVASKQFMSCTWPGCNALFKSKIGLRTHVQRHKGENEIHCDWPGCNYLARNKRQHENHIRKHTGDRPYSCDYPGCESKFRTNDSLRHHKKSHSEYRPFRCDWPGCESHFKTNRGLTIHRALHTGEKLFKCDWPECNFASERKYHVDLHIFENHTHTKPYACSWVGCDASFLRNDKLQNHLKIHRKEKPFKCIHPLCDKHFVEKGNMMKHFNNVHKR